MRPTFHNMVSRSFREVLWMCRVLPPTKKKITAPSSYYGQQPSPNQTPTRLRELVPSSTPPGPPPPSPITPDVSRSALDPVFCAKPRVHTSHQPKRPPRTATFINLAAGFLFDDDDFVNTTTPHRRSTRLNSSHVRISYAVFCLKKKKKRQIKN